MVIWINGAFGSGKTTAAMLLHSKIENSYVYDPENVGTFLCSNMPSCMLRDDFQDEPLWRKFNFDIIKNISDNFDGTIIIPMTITNIEYYKEIIGRLRDSGITVNHFVLSVPKEILIKRLSEPERSSDSREWAVKKIDVCTKTFLNCEFEGVINTENMSVDEITEYILKEVQTERPHIS